MLSVGYLACEIPKLSKYKHTNKTLYTYETLNMHECREYNDDRDNPCESQHTFSIHYHHTIHIILPSNCRKIFSTI